MPVRVLVPTPLRPYVGGTSSVEVAGRTVGDALNDLVRRHEGMRKHLFDGNGSLRSFVNLYVNDEDIRHLAKMSTELGESDVITIVPSVAGGAARGGEAAPWRG
jgi:adenylyltransferase/sulfurtransferase